jgi:manganese oxidase
MSTSSPGPRKLPISSVLIFGLPIALALLLVPAVMVLAPSRQAQQTATTSGAATSATVTPAQTAPEVHLAVKEWSFQPSTLQLPVGKPVTLVLDNKGQLDHDVTIPSLGISLKAPSGRSVAQTVTADKAGSFAFLCSIPGHKEAGMQGQVEVGNSPSASASDMAGMDMSMPGMDMSAPSSATDSSIQRVGEQAVQMGSHAAVATTSVKANQPLAFELDGQTKVFELQAKAFKWEVLPGEYVDAYGYAGADGIASVPGPLIRVTEGDQVRVNFTNNLPEPTVIHFHGPRIPNAMDGVADVTQQVIQPGASFTYEFTASPTGTFMYHTHHNSAEQEGKGLYGVFQIDPKDGPRVQADQEVFQVLSEMGGFYLINGKSFPATEPIEANVGQKVLIHLVNLGQMTHPMHMHGAPFKIVGTDGYAVPETAQLTKDVVAIAPGERYDLLMTADNPGSWLFHCHILTHVQNHGVEPGGMLTLIKVNG